MTCGESTSVQMFAWSTGCDLAMGLTLQDSEWNPADPLWPNGYRTDLLAVSDDETPCSTGKAPSSPRFLFFQLTRNRMPVSGQATVRFASLQCVPSFPAAMWLNHDSAETDELVERLYAVGSGRNHTLADTFKRFARMFVRAACLIVCARLSV